MNIFNETHDVTRRSWDYNVILVVVLFGFSFSWLYVVFSYSFSSNVLRSVSFMIIRWITVFRPVWAEFVNELSLLRDGYLELPSYVSESRSKILRLWPPPRQKLCDQSGLSDSHSVCLSVCLCVCVSVSRITAKVISRFHWNLVLWLGLPIERTDYILAVIRSRIRIPDHFSLPSPLRNRGF